MKTILILLLLLNPIMQRASNTLSVASYGATGNGTTDDTNAINNCLVAAKTAGKNVYFPPGNYLCNTITSNNILTLSDMGNKNNVTIYGDDSSTTHIITSSNSTSTLLYIYASLRCYGLTLANLGFVNTHGNISVSTTGVFVQGTSGEFMDTVTIRNCSFAGFNTAIGLQGAVGPSITKCIFASPKGHNNGMQNNSPCPFIWAFDNSNGSVLYGNVKNNIASGYTGPLPINCPRPSDGFIYGVWYGLNAEDNRCYNFSQEIIDVQPYVTKTQTNSPYVINVTGNLFDCTLPPGCVDSAGGLHKYNYGVRIDVPNANINGNQFVNYTWGILSRPVDFATDSVYNFNASNNTFITPSDTTTNIVQHDIAYIGNSNIMSGLVFNNNKTLRSDTVRMQIVTTSATTQLGNFYRPTNN